MQNVTMRGDCETTDGATALSSNSVTVTNRFVFHTRSLPPPTAAFHNSSSQSFLVQKISPFWREEKREKRGEWSCSLAPILMRPIISRRRKRRCKTFQGWNELLKWLPLLRLNYAMCRCFARRFSR